MNELIRRRALLMGKKGSSWQDYIQEGLIFQLDGINKGGNSGTWTDLIGGIVFDKVGNPQELPDGWQFSEGNYFHSQEWLGDLLSLTVPDSQVTIECAYQGNPNCSYSFGKNVGSIRYYGQGYFILSNSTGGPRLSIEQPRVPVTGKHSLSWGAVVKSSEMRLVIDQEDTLINNVDQWDRMGEEIYIGAWGRANELYACAAKLLSVRVYNRFLSEEEMLFNQAIDYQRFNIV